jgi:hypothetical protein
MVGNAINALDHSNSINVEKPIPGRGRADLTLERAGRGALVVEAKLVRKTKASGREVQAELGRIVHDILGLFQAKREEVEDGLAELQEICTRRKESDDAIWVRQYD